MNFYAANATRGYPLDDAATGLSDAGERLPDGLLVDACVRFPQTLGYVVHISAVRCTETHVSVVLSIGLTPVASLLLARPLVEGRAYQLRSLVTGVGGWLVFGSEPPLFQGRFSTSGQSALVARTARSYAAPAVSAISRDDAAEVLAGIVTIAGGSDIEVVRAPRVINDIERDAIVIRLKAPLADTLLRYVGPCGGRPESGTCSSPAIEQVNDAIPDEDGNIEITPVGLDITTVDGALLMHTALKLPKLCPDRKWLRSQPDDTCEDPPPEEPEEPEDPDGDGSVDPPEDPEPPGPVLYPLNERWFQFGASDPGHIVTAAGWTLSAMPTGSGGIWGAYTDLSSLFVGGDLGFPGPLYMLARSGNGFVRILGEEYTQTRGTNGTCLFRPRGNGQYGLLFDLIPGSGVGARSYAAVIDTTTKQFAIYRRGSSPTSVGTLIASSSWSIIQPNEWYRVTVTITAEAGSPGTAAVQAQAWRVSNAGVPTGPIPPRTLNISGLTVSEDDGYYGYVGSGAAHDLAQLYINI